MKPQSALIGWQTLLADLSLILFMVTAAALATKPHVVVPPQQPALGEAVALWRAGGAQTMRYWLAGQEPDARQQLTITVRYRRGDAARTLATTQALVSQAAAMGRDARVIVVPVAAGDAEETLATLAYDQAH